MPEKRRRSILKHYCLQEIIHVQLPSFITAEVPPTLPNLHPGEYVYRDSLSLHLHRISVLIVLSGQVTEGLELRGAHESYLTSKMDSFIEVIPELMNWWNGLFLTGVKKKRNVWRNIHGRALMKKVWQTGNTDAYVILLKQLMLLLSNLLITSLRIQQKNGSSNIMGNK